MRPGRGLGLAAFVTAAFLVLPAGVHAETADQEIASFILDPETVVFETEQEGYKASEIIPLTVSVINDGDTDIQFTMPVSENGYMDLEGLDDVVLQPGEEAEFTVSPSDGLTAGEYEDLIIVEDLKGNADPQSVTVLFKVEKIMTELLSVTYPETKLEIPNGTEKSAAAFGLPAAVELETNQGKREAVVNWNVFGSTYDPQNQNEQVFMLHGKVILPNDISNSRQIDTECEVQVRALARAPILADADQNTITGIDSKAEYTTETRISFTAIGAGMGNGNPVEGDTRFCPSGWKVLEGRPFEKESYGASFRISEAGGFALTVTFLEQKYDGEAWRPTGTEDKKEVAFNVQEMPEKKEAPGGNKDRNGEGREEKGNVALTADEADAVRYLFLMGAAGASFLLAYVLKKKKI